MSYKKQALIQFLNDSFNPVKLYAPIKWFKTLNYKNPLFEISLRYVPGQGCNSNLDTAQTIYRYGGFQNIQNFGNIHFIASYYDSFVVSNKLNGIALYLQNIFQSKKLKNQNLFVDIYTPYIENKTDTDDTIVCLDTYGKIPERWVRMICDFADSEKLTKLEFCKSHSVDYADIINETPDIIIDNIISNIMHIYNSDSCKFYITNIEKLFKNYPNLKFELEQNFSAEYIQSRKFEIKNGSFYTINSKMSILTELLSIKAGALHSYNYTKLPFTELYAAEGGLNLEPYLYDVPFTKLAISLNMFAGSPCLEFKGIDICARKQTTVEEVVIFAELLKKYNCKYVEIYKNN